MQQKSRDTGLQKAIKAAGGCALWRAQLVSRLDRSTSLIAYHEAGHAVVARVLGVGRPRADSVR